MKFVPDILGSVLIVAIGGALGAGSRYLIGGWIQTQFGSLFPWGTFIVNVSGSLLIGIVIGFADKGILSTNARLFLTTGILGGYTTFSTFSFETMSLFISGGKGMALLNTVGQTFIGLIAAYTGFVLIRLIIV